MAKNAILKTNKKYYLLNQMCKKQKKTKKKKKANEATFPIKFGNPDLMERFLPCFEII